MQSHAKRVGPALWTKAVAGVTVLLLGSAVMAVRAEQAKTVKDGVYTDEQAKKGEALYGEQCASCHSADLSGGGAPALAGGDFIGFWDKTPVNDLVEKVVTTMPASSPGSLNRAQGAEIVAFMLQKNKFPAGSAELPSDAAALKAITIAK